MYRPAWNGFRRHAGRAAAGKAVSFFVFLLLCAACDGRALFAQVGERGREQTGERGREQRVRIKAHPRVAARRRLRSRVRAQSAEVSVWVVSNPAGCKVYVDDEPRGETNADGDLEVRLAPGTHLVRVSREGYISQEGEVEVSDAIDDQEVEFEFDLAIATVSLNVVTDPSGTEIYLDDVYRGTSNPSGLLVIERVGPNQPHKLRAAKDGYQQQSVPLNSYSGQISIKLLPDSVELQVKTDPPETEVYLDGVYKGTSTTEGILLIEQVNPNQSHTLRAKRDGYVSQSANVPHDSPEATIKLAPDPVVLLVKSLKQNAAQGRLGEALADYERLAAAAPDQQELPRLLESILQGLQARTAVMLRSVGPYGLLTDLTVAQEMAGLYDQAARLRPDDESSEEFAKYWGLKLLVARASSAPPAERDEFRRKARALLSDIGTRGSRNVYLLLDLGWVWLWLGDGSAAQKNFQQVQELKPDWAYVYFALGTLAMRDAEGEANKSAKAAKYAQAISNFTRAIELKHDLARAYALRSISYGVINRYEEAVASGLQAVAIEPQSAYGHFALGFAYFQKGKASYRKALDEFNQISIGGGELDEATRNAIEQKLALIRRMINK